MRVPGKLRFLLSILFVFVLTGAASAGIIRKWIYNNTQANQYWSNPNNWSPYGVPQIADKLEFIPNYGNIVYLDVNPPVINRLTMRAGGGVTFLSLGAARTLTLSSTDTSLYISPASGSLSAGYCWISTVGGSYPVCTINFSGAGNKAIVNGFMLVGVGGAYNATNSNTIVGGQLSHGYGGNGGPITSSAINLRFLAGSQFDNANLNGSIPYATWDLGSLCKLMSQTQVGLDQSFGNFNVDQNGPGNFDFGGKLQNVKGDLRIYTSFPGSTYTFTTNMAMTLNVGGTFMVMDHMESPANYISKIILTNGSANPVINVAGSFSKNLGNTARVDFGSGTGYATMNVKQDFYCTKIPIVRTGSGTNGQVNFSGIYFQYLVCDTSDKINYTTLTSAAVVLQGNMVLNKTQAAFAGQFSVNAGSSIDMATYVIKGISTGSNFNSMFNLYAGAELKTAHPGGVGTLGTGSLQTNYKNINSNVEFIYNGTTPQVTGLVGGPYKYFQFYNTKGVTASAPYSVTGSFRAETHCYLKTTASTIFTVNSGAENWYGAGWIVGPMQKVGNQDFFFPLGSVTSTDISSFGIFHPANANDTIMAEYIASSAEALGIVSNPAMNRVSNCQYIKVTYKGTGPKMATVTSGWNATTAACFNAFNLDEIVLARFNGSTWNDFGEDSKSGNSQWGGVRWENQTTFGIFALGVKQTTGISKGTPGGVSIKESSVAGVQAIWPVPSDGSVTIDRRGVKNSSTITAARIFNAGGQQISIVDLRDRPSQRVDLRTSGLYLVNFVTKDGKIVESRKFVVR